MNILLLAPHPFFQHRGTPIAVRLLVEVLAKNGHTIDILTYHEGEDIIMSNVRIHRIQRIPGVQNIPPGPSWKKNICDISLFFKCFQLIRRYRFDLIHAVEESALISMIAKQIFHIPYVYDMDSSLAQQMNEEYRAIRPLNKALEFLERILIRQSIGVLAVCKYLEDIAHKHDPQKPIVRLEDISLLKKNSQKLDPLKENLKIRGPIVMYVGNLQKYQGIDLLLDSFRMVITKIPDANLVIIGGSESDIQTYKAHSIHLGINDRVQFLGQRPSSLLGSFLDLADVLISPRIKGVNTPMKIYSYLDSGRPVLATRLPTHTQVLDDQIALLVSPETKAMADGICYLIKNSEHAHVLSNNAKQRVKKEFSYEAFQGKLINFYHILEDKIALNVHTTK